MPPLNSGLSLANLFGISAPPSPALNPYRELPIFAGASAMLWDGTQLWVADGDATGSGGPAPPYNAINRDPRTRYLRVIDTTTTPDTPVLIKSIDLQPFAPFSNTMDLKLSNNGLYIYVCIRANAYVSDLTAAKGRVLIVDKTTYSIVGNAEMTGGTIGPGADKATGARSCVEDSNGHLFVTNSNADTSNWIEKFTIATVLANGVAPTTRTAIISCPSHAEELAFDGTFIWTTGWSYTSTVQRLNPSTNTIQTCTDPLNRFAMGCTFVLGELWAIDSNAGLLRIDRTLFSPGGTVDMSPGSNSLTIPVSENWYSQNCITSDGTNLWVGNQGALSGVAHMWKINPIPGSLAILATVPIQFPGNTVGNFHGAYKIAFDGYAIWGSMRRRGSPGNGVPMGQPSALVRVVTTGTPHQDFWWAGPPRSLWVVDRQIQNLTRVDTTNPAVPVIKAQIDLSGLTSAAGAKRVKVNVAAIDNESNTNHVYIAPFGDPAAPFAILDASTENFVGLGSVSTGGDSMRPVDFAFGADPTGQVPDGTVYVLAQNANGNGICKIYKYLWKNILTAYPSLYTTTTAKFSPGFHIEEIVYGAGFIWGTAGQNGPVNKVYRIDPSSGAVVTYTHGGSSRLFGCLFAFGSLWVTSGNSNFILRFDPATFPGGTPTTIIVDPGGTISNTAELGADDTTIWVSNGSNSTNALPYAFRVSTGLGTEAVIATLTIPGTDGTSQGVAFDGQTIWIGVRNASTAAGNGVASINPHGAGPGETFITLFNPGFLSHAFNDVTSIATD